MSCIPLSLWRSVENYADFLSSCRYTIWPNRSQNVYQDQKQRPGVNKSMNFNWREAAPYASFIIEPRLTQTISFCFQSHDPTLRRTVYLGIKELSSIADDVIIVTSSLTKDMTGKEDLYRAAAIRALCSITDVTMLQAIERYMKQAIVDRNPAVSSAALVSSLHLTKIASEVVKRWVNEAQEAVNSDKYVSTIFRIPYLVLFSKTTFCMCLKITAYRNIPFF